MPVVAAALAVAVRRFFPLPALAVVAAAVCAYMLLGQFYGPILFSLGVALYTVAAHRPLRVSAVAAGAVGVLMVISSMLGTGFGIDGVVPIMAWAVAPLAVGVTVRVTREQRLQNRRDEIRRQADAERLRVAQEVHDVVGHGLAAINMQAEIALHLLAKQREARARRRPAALTADQPRTQPASPARRAAGHARCGAPRRGSRRPHPRARPGPARRAGGPHPFGRRAGAGRRGGPGDRAAGGGGPGRISNRAGVARPTSSGTRARPPRRCGWRSATKT